VVAPEGGAMIASWRGLAVAAAIAAALAAVVAVDVARAPAIVPIERALVPGFDPARATELIWERAGQPEIRAVRAGQRWELRVPEAVAADAGAIGDVLAALRGARWHRRGEAPPPHATLTVVAGGERHVLGIAAPIAGTEQSWIVDDGRGAVVDRWVARALDRDRLALQIRRPFADVGAARSIRVFSSSPDDDAYGELKVEGTPRRLVQPSLLLDPGVAAGLDRALRDITVVRVTDGPVPGRGLSISVEYGDATPRFLELGGPCPGASDLVAVLGSIGPGCIERAARDAVRAALGRLGEPPAEIVERRPVPFEPAHAVLPDGAALDTSPPRIGDAAADPTRVAELLAALAAPAEVARLPAAPPIAHLTATDRAGAAIALDLFADRVLARHGEPVALRPAPGAWNLLVRPSRELRELTLWVEEPTTITALAIDDVRYQRGQVIGAWSRQPAGPVDAARVEALVAQLAAPRALGFADGPLAAAHRVTIEVTPPVGAPTRHALELGAPRASGCPARSGGDTVVLPAAICAEIAALARPPPHP
jgi:hypothetical protein